MIHTLAQITERIFAASRVARDLRTPGTPAGDADEEHEANTYGLPEGRLIRRAYKRFAKRQLKKILGTIPSIGSPLPAKFPSLDVWNKPMSTAMTPIISTYWDDAGKTTRARLGLDPDKWEVHDPHLYDMIQRASFRFCESTNATTDEELQTALDRLRLELTLGLVEHGTTIPELTARVQDVFTRLSTSRAETIARTEASRAVHAASLQSARESGVVSGKRWLLSSDACDKCVAAAAKFPKGAGLDDSFAITSPDPDYGTVLAPPLHPNCRCTLTYVLTPEYEKLLEELGPEEPFGPFEPNGSLGPDNPPTTKKRKRELAAV